MSSTCVAFICDDGFLPNTLIAAQSARRNCPDDVPIYCFVTDGSSLTSTENVAGVNIVRVGETVDAALTKTQHKVPPATFARLYLDSFLPTDVRRFLYLDGDVFCARPLAPLLNVELNRAGLAAVVDTTATSALRHYVGSHVAYINGYFNAGVLLCDRAAWRTIAADCLAACLANLSLNDQDGLNRVTDGQFIRLSPKWNYHSAMVRLANPLRWHRPPAIWHFTGKLKPWKSGHRNIPSAIAMEFANIKTKVCSNQIAEDSMRRAAKRQRSPVEGILRASSYFRFAQHYISTYSKVTI